MKKQNIKKELAVIGLGKMGANMCRHLHEQGWKVSVYNRTSEITQKLGCEGLQATYSLQKLAGSVSSPKTVWLMVSHNAVDSVLKELTPLLKKGDTVIDGGNSPYQESIRRSIKLAKYGINFLDVGFSGGPSGARNGGCLMIGGKRGVYKKYEKLFKDLSIEDGYKYLGEAGAGHFVKMIHNGIEYGMMQAIGEGFEVLRKSKFKLNLKDVASLYNHRSVIESRLIGWLLDAYEEHGENLADVSGSVAHTGEGEWTVQAARKLKVPVKIIEESFRFRVASKQKPSYTGKVVSALREQFGGHSVK